MNSCRYLFIKGYGKKYALYEDGTVLRLPTKYRRKAVWLKPKKNQPYQRVTLYKDGKYNIKSIHRLLAIHFIPNPENKEFVNHKDGNRYNNDLENLEWCTARENLMHSIEVLKSVRNTKKQKESAVKVGKAKRKLTMEQAELVKRLVKSMTRKDVAKKFGVSVSLIDGIVSGRRYLD